MSPSCPDNGNGFLLSLPSYRGMAFESLHFGLIVSSYSLTGLITCDVINIHCRIPDWLNYVKKRKPKKNMPKSKGRKSAISRDTGAY